MSRLITDIEQRQRRTAPAQSLEIAARGALGALNGVLRYCNLPLPGDLLARLTVARENLSDALRDCGRGGP